MTAPRTSLPSRLDPVGAAWLAGGLFRAVDTLLVSRLEAGRVRVVDGLLEGEHLDRNDPLDGVLAVALGARGRRDVETVRWRASRDRRLDEVRLGLVTDGLLGERTRLGLRATDGRPAPTAAGRRLLRELRTLPRTGGAWEVDLEGRAALTDRGLHEALEPPARPPLPAQARGSRPERHRRRDRTAEGYASGAAFSDYGSWGAFGGGGGGDCGGGGDGGGC